MFIISKDYECQKTPSTGDFLSQEMSSWLLDKRNRVQFIRNCFCVKICHHDVIPTSLAIMQFVIDAEYTVLEVGQLVSEGHLIGYMNSMLIRVQTSMWLT